jgi:copper oxidase (laccase) domain-containing protein
MRGTWGVDPADMLVGFGPCIRQCCYEVSQEFKQLFGASVREEKNKAYFDIAQENSKQLLALGVRPEHIFDSRLCTCCRSDTYFSYRKEGSAAGRMMSVVMIKKGAG